MTNKLHLAVSQYLNTSLSDGADYNSGDNTQRIEVYHRGYIFVIELKTKNVSLSDNQKERHKNLRKAGVPVRVCRSIEDVEDFLRNYGIPLKGEIKGRYAPKDDKSISGPYTSHIVDDDDAVAKAKRALLNLKNKKPSEDGSSEGPLCMTALTEMQGEF